MDLRRYYDSTLPGDFLCPKRLLMRGWLHLDGLWFYNHNYCPSIASDWHLRITKSFYTYHYSPEVLHPGNPKYSFGLYHEAISSQHRALGRQGWSSWHLYHTPNSRAVQHHQSATVKASHSLPLIRSVHANSESDRLQTDAV